jgi:hypothetical protein
VILASTSAYTKISIESVKTHINRVKKSTYSVNKLDVDLLKQKTIEFYELIFELEKTLNVSTFDTDKITSDEEPSTEGTSVSEKKAIEIEIISIN